MNPITGLMSTSYIYNKDSTKKSSYILYMPKAKQD